MTRPNPGVGGRYAQATDTEATETWAWQSEGLASLRASITRDVSGSTSPAFEGQDGDPQLPSRPLKALTLSSAQGHGMSPKSADSVDVMKESIVQWKWGGSPLLGRQF